MSNLGNFLLCVISLSGSALSAQDTVRVLFAGDIMQHETQLIAARRDSGVYDYSDCFRYVAPVVKKAGVAIANLETPLGVEPYSGYPAFSAPAALACAVRDAGFDVLVTANNHSLDRGRRGVMGTVRILDSLGIPHTGIFRDTLERTRRYPLVFSKGGIRFALLDYTYGTNGISHPKGTFVNTIDTVQIKKDIAAAKAKRPDVILACVHWGIEYKSIPEKSQEDLARLLTDNGVSVVIGSHPHVVQPMHTYRDSQGNIRQVVVYSLGNYISNQRTVDTQGGATASVTFVRDSTGVRIADCTYGLVWVWKPVEGDVQRFFLLPVREVEKGIYPLSADQRARMDTFAKNARSLFEKYNTGVKEY